MISQIKSIIAAGFAFSVAGLICALPSHSAAEAFAAKAKAAYMIDAETGTVLLAQNDSLAFAPASLSKLMTVELVLSYLNSGALQGDQSFQVSEFAWRTGGAPSGTSTMFAAWRSFISVDDLLRGIVVHNGNDACLILAEGVAGSDAAFAQMMNKRAREIGLRASNFVNSTGLPADGNATTAKDVVLLAQHLYKNYPQFYPTFSQPEFLWNKIAQRNKNSVLFADLGIDGLGLGFTEGFGYSAAVSASLEGRRIYLALAGMDDLKTRQDEVRRVVDWGLHAFEKRRLYARDAAVGQVSVYGGSQSKIDALVKDDVDIVILRKNPERLTGRINYKWPLNAPLRQGDEIGTLSVFAGPALLREVPVYAGVSVETGSLTQRAGDAIMELLFFWL